MESLGFLNLTGFKKSRLIMCIAISLIGVYILLTVYIKSTTIPGGETFNPNGGFHQMTDRGQQLQLFKDSRPLGKETKTINKKIVNSNLKSKYTSTVVSSTKCHKKKEVAFLKVHKCGSTTVSNIIQRFGIKTGLNFVLPNKSGHQFWVLGVLDKHTPQKVIPLKKDERYHLLTVDTVYNKDVYQTLIPDHPFYLAILRDPVERFISATYYFNTEVRDMLMKRPPPYRFRNFPVTPLGAIRDFNFQNRNKTSFLKDMDHDFDFVIITEYFDESLVLLKRKLCWATGDIIYMIRNKNPLKKGYALNPNDRNRIAEKQTLDVKFYNHFKQKLFKNIISLGVDFLEEVDSFKIVLSLVRDYCTYKESNQPLVIPETKWSDKISLNATDCHLMSLKEFPLVKQLQARQWSKYHAK